MYIFSIIALKSFPFEAHVYTATFGQNSLLYTETLYTLPGSKRFLKFLARGWCQLEMLCEPKMLWNLHSNLLLKYVCLQGLITDITMWVYYPEDCMSSDFSLLS